MSVTPNTNPPCPYCKSPTDSVGSDEMGPLFWCEVCRRFHLAKEPKPDDKKGDGK